MTHHSVASFSDSRNARWDALLLMVCLSTAMLCLRRKHAALGPVTREYNTNGPDWWDRLDDLWPALSKYVHKFKRLKKRYSTPDDVRRFQASRSMTLMHGDLHPANALVTRNGGQSSSGARVQVAIFDWAEINVGSGAEELAHFILRSRFYEDVASNADVRNKQCASLSDSCTRSQFRCLAYR